MRFCYSRKHVVWLAVARSMFFTQVTVWVIFKIATLHSLPSKAPQTWSLTLRLFLRLFPKVLPAFGHSVGRYKLIANSWHCYSSKLLVLTAILGPKMFARNLWMVATVDHSHGDVLTGGENKYIYIYMCWFVAVLFLCKRSSCAWLYFH